MAIKWEWVIRDGKKKKRYYSTLPDHKLQKTTKDGKLKEVKYTEKEKNRRETAQKAGQDKRNINLDEMTKKRLKSMQKKMGTDTKTAEKMFDHDKELERMEKKLSLDEGIIQQAKIPKLERDIILAAQEHTNFTDHKALDKDSNEISFKLNTESGVFNFYFILDKNEIVYPSSLEKIFEDINFLNRFKRLILKNLHFDGLEKLNNLSIEHILDEEITDVFNLVMRDQLMGMAGGGKYQQQAYLKKSAEYSVSHGKSSGSYNDGTQMIKNVEQGVEGVGDFVIGEMNHFALPEKQLNMFDERKKIAGQYAQKIKDGEINTAQAIAGIAEYFHLTVAEAAALLRNNL